MNALLQRLKTRDEPWGSRLEEFLTDVRRDIVDREHDGAPPTYAFDRAKELRLLGLTVPRQFGGEGATIRDVAEASRAIARVDGGLAHAFAYHWVWASFVGAYALHHDQPAASRIAEQTASEQLVWASIGSAFGGSGGIRRDGDACRISVTRGFATGSSISELLFTQTVLDDDGRMYIWAVPNDREGVTVDDSWNPLGQRLSASPRITLDDVRVTADDLIAVVNPPSEHPEPVQSLMIPAFQLILAWLAVGIAEGALLEARDYILESGRPWVHSEAASANEDTHVLAGIGEHVAAVSAAAALAREATDELETLLENPTSASAHQRGTVAEVIAAAKIHSQHTGLAATSSVFDWTGARSAAGGLGLDRHWRNLRTLSLHDPVAYKHEEVGRYFVNGELPTPSVYR